MVVVFSFHSDISIVANIINQKSICFGTIFLLVSVPIKDIFLYSMSLSLLSNCDLNKVS